MPIYNLLEHSDNYFMRRGSFWNYYRDKIDDVNDNASDCKPFKCKIKVIVKKEGRLAQPLVPPEGVDQMLRPPVPTLNTEVTISLKPLSSFWRLLIYL